MALASACGLTLCCCRGLKVADVDMTVQIKGVSPHTSAIDAFIIMQQENLSSLAIIDEQGRLVDNLSASDLKGIAFEPNLKSLTKPLPDFFHEIELLNLKRRQVS
jgi:CBS-domain-containing membrane protein